MTEKQYRQFGHGMRWFLELVVVWDFVYDETGMWTCIALTMITVGIEWDHFNWKEWKR